MRNWLKGLMVAGALLTGCSGVEAELDEQAPALGESQAALEYNEDLHCLVPGPYVRCNSGIQMASYWSAELNHWFIQRNVCGSRGPIICPL